MEVVPECLLSYSDGRKVRTGKNGARERGGKSTHWMLHSDHVQVYNGYWRALGVMVLCVVKFNTQVYPLQNRR